MRRLRRRENKWLILACLYHISPFLIWSLPSWQTCFCHIFRLFLPPPAPCSNRFELALIDTLESGSANYIPLAKSGSSPNFIRAYLCLFASALSVTAFLLWQWNSCNRITCDPQSLKSLPTCFYKKCLLTPALEFSFLQLLHVPFFLPGVLFISSGWWALTFDSKPSETFWFLKKLAASSLELPLFSVCFYFASIPLYFSCSFISLCDLKIAALLYASLYLTMPPNSFNTLCSHLIFIETDLSSSWLLCSLAYCSHIMWGSQRQKLC